MTLTFMKAHTLLLAACLALSGNAPAQRTPEETQSGVERLVQAGELVKAEGLLEQRLLQDPEWKDGLWKLGLIRYQRDQFAAALEPLRRLTGLDPGKGAAWALLGMCEFQLGRFAQSIEHVDQADRLGIPEHLGLRDTAYLNRAMAYIQLGSYGTAVELLSALVPRETPNERDRLAFALGFAAMHQPLRDPESADEAAWLRGAGEAHYLAAEGKRDQARALLEDLCRQHPKAPMLRYAYGSLLLKWLESEAAQKQFRAELSLNPASFPAHLGLAYAALDEEQSGAGLDHAREAIRLRPDAYQAHLYCGRLLLRDGRREEARAELETAKGLAPAVSAVRFSLARAYRALGRESDAARELQEFERLKAIEEPARAERVADRR